MASDSGLADPRIYQEHYGWTRTTTLFAAGSAVVLVLAAAPLLPLGLRLLLGLCSALGLALTVGVCAGHPLALRVDPQGVTLGAIPIRRAVQRDFVPWDQIAAIVLWSQPVSATSTMTYIGVQRQRGAPSLPGSLEGRGIRRIDQSRIPGIPLEIVKASRPVNLWRLDRDRLALAVAAFRPEIRIVTIGSPRVPR